MTCRLENYRSNDRTAWRAKCHRFDDPAPLPTWNWLLHRRQLFRAMILCLVGPWFRASATFSATSAPPPDLGTRTSGEDWPGFLGPRGDNRSTETGLRLNWSTSHPPLVWSTALGEGYGIGSIARGRYFQFDYRDQQASLECLESETGRELWRFAYPSNYVDMYGYGSGPRTTPVVDEDRVYIFGVQGELYCLRVEDGSVVWRVDTEQQFGVVPNFFGVGSTPRVYGDLLITVVGGSPREDHPRGRTGQLDRLRGNGSAIVALDKHTGKVRYQLSDELASYGSPQIVRQDGRDWCFAFLRAGLLAFDPSTGQQDFHFPWRARLHESVNASTPVVWDQHVFISESYGPGAALLRFYPGGYDVVWSDVDRRREKAMQTHWNTPVYHDGYLYGSSGRHSHDAELRCIEAATGRVMWSEPDLTRNSLLYVDKHLICLSEYGTLRVIRSTPERYELVSEWTPVERDQPLLKYPAWAAPALSHGLLYVRGRDRLACYDLSPRDTSPQSE